MMFQQNRYRVVILDSGVNTSHAAFCGVSIDVVSFHLELDGTPVIQSVQRDEIGHGTAVFSIINQKVPADQILNINIFQDTDALDEEVLLGALRFVRDHVEADIINLSLGIQTTGKREKLQAVCRELTAKGTFLFSAFDGVGTLTYPAVFPEVFGVLSGKHCVGKSDLEYFEGDDVVTLGAFGRNQRLPWKGDNEFHLCGGCSFSCAYASALAAEYLQNEQTHTLAGLHAFFRERAVKMHAPRLQKLDSNGALFPICRAALFPFSKEMHSLLRYPELLNFEISAVYDSKYKMMIGAHTKELIWCANAPDYVIQDVQDIDWNAFDTLILGHLDELAVYSKDPELRERIVQAALDHGVQIYSFDPLPNRMKEKEKGTVFFPFIGEEQLPPFRYDKLFKPAVPVLGIFGTTPQQGKFTLQLKLRQLCLQRGYDIGQIGTEPSALLFGMDYVYPIGYNSVEAVKIKDHDVIRYLNNLIHCMEVKGKELVIVGSQSGTVTLDRGNLYYHPIYPYSFLLGTAPDAVVLCVNPSDKPEFINRTIQFIESGGDCRVIALILFPVLQHAQWTSGVTDRTSLTREECVSYLKRLTEQFHCPAFQLGEEADMEALLDTIVDYYTE